MFSQHYRSSMELNEVTIENSRSARRRVENFARLIDLSRPETEASVALSTRARDAFFDRLDDDFDAPGALAVLFDFIREKNRSGEPPGQSVRSLLRDVDDLFDTFNLDEQKIDSIAIEAELDRRRELRVARNFQEADAIRSSLEGRGIAIADTAEGTRWWIKEPYDFRV